MGLMFRLQANYAIVRLKNECEGHHASDKNGSDQILSKTGKKLKKHIFYADNR